MSELLTSLCSDLLTKLLTTIDSILIEKCDKDRFQIMVQGQQYRGPGELITLTLVLNCYLFYQP